LAEGISVLHDILAAGSNATGFHKASRQRCAAGLLQLTGRFFSGALAQRTSIAAISKLRPWRFPFQVRANISARYFSIWLLLDSPP
jgi:hypothetical protein